MAGYSGTPLVRKLGVKAGFRMYVEGAPPHYADLVAPLPEGVRVETGEDARDLDFVHVFVERAAGLAARLAALRTRIVPAGMVWVSWPKRASGVATDVTEDVVRAAALEVGLVDVKVCAVDDVWSGLKLMVRRSDRADRPPPPARRR
jgi:hypothetical protein